MENDEVLRKKDHYRCRCCGKLSPITAAVCTKPGCQAQLSLYGDLIPGEEYSEIKKPEPKMPEPEGPKIKIEQPKYTEEFEQPKKPVKEKKVKERKTVVQESSNTSFLQKKTCLTMLNMMFFWLYCSMVYITEQSQSYTSDNLGDHIYRMGICIGVSLAFTALAVFLVQKGQYVLHGILSIVNGVISTLVALVFLEIEGAYVLGLRGEKAPMMFLAMLLAYLWLGIISFIGISQKRKAMAAEGRASAFLRKKTTLVGLDIIGGAVGIALVLFGAAVFSDYVTKFAWRYSSSDYWKYRADYDLYWDGWVFAKTYFDKYKLLSFLPVVLAALNIWLACVKQHILRGAVYCLVGIICACSTVMLDVNLYFGWIGITAASLYIWLGVLSFLKEK